MIASHDSSVGSYPHHTLAFRVFSIVSFSVVFLGHYFLSLFPLETGKTAIICLALLSQDNKEEHTKNKVIRFQ